MPSLIRPSSESYDGHLEETFLRETVAKAHQTIPIRKPAQVSASQFLSLPQEVRDMIYTHLLDVEEMYYGARFHAVVYPYRTNFLETPPQRMPIRLRRISVSAVPSRVGREDPSWWNMNQRTYGLSGACRQSHHEIMHYFTTNYELEIQPHVLPICRFLRHTGPTLRAMITKIIIHLAVCLIGPNREVYQSHDFPYQPATPLKQLLDSLPNIREAVCHLDAVFESESAEPTIGLQVARLLRPVTDLEKFGLKQHPENRSSGRIWAHVEREWSVA